MLVIDKFIATAWNLCILLSFSILDLIYLLALNQSHRSSSALDWLLAVSIKLISSILTVFWSIKSFWIFLESESIWTDDWRIWDSDGSSLSSISCFKLSHTWCWSQKDLNFNLYLAISWFCLTLKISSFFLNLSLQLSICLFRSFIRLPLIFFKFAR